MMKTIKNWIIVVLLVVIAISLVVGITTLQSVKSILKDEIGKIEIANPDEQNSIAVDQLTEEFLTQNQQFQEESLQVQKELLKEQQKTNELLRANVKAISNLSNDFNAYRQELTEVIISANNSSDSAIALSIGAIEENLCEIGNRLECIQETTQNIADNPSQINNTTNIFNQYTVIEEQGKKDPEDIDDPSPKEDEQEDKDEDSTLVLSDETVYVTSESISFTAEDDTEYVFAVEMFSEQLVLNFPDDADLSLVCVKLYADTDKSGEVIMDPDGSLYTSSEEVDGVYYVVISGLPSGDYNIAIG